MRELEFPFQIRQRVRYAEADGAGVVYHATYLIYADVGRMAYLQALVLDPTGDRDQRVSFVIGEVAARFHRPLHFDEEFDVRVRVGEVRRKAWTMECQIVGPGGMPCSDISTTHVQFDLQAGRASELGGDLARRLREAEVGSRSGSDS